MKKFLFIPLILMLVSCEKELTPNLFFYDETGCSDAWWEDAPQIDTLTPQIYEEWVTNYLVIKNIEVFSFKSPTIQPWLNYAMLAIVKQVLFLN